MSPLLPNPPDATAAQVRWLRISRPGADPVHGGRWAQYRPELAPHALLELLDSWLAPAGGCWAERYQPIMLGDLRGVQATLEVTLPTGAQQTRTAVATLEHGVQSLPTLYAVALSAAARRLGLAANLTRLGVQAAQVTEQHRLAAGEARRLAELISPPDTAAAELTKLRRRIDALPGWSGGGYVNGTPAEAWVRLRQQHRWASATDPNARAEMARYLDELAASSTPTDLPIQDA